MGCFSERKHAAHPPSVPAILSEITIIIIIIFFWTILVVDWTVYL